MDIHRLKKPDSVLREGGSRGEGVKEVEGRGSQLLTYLYKDEMISSVAFYKSVKDALKLLYPSNFNAVWWLLTQFIRVKRGEKMENGKRKRKGKVCS